MTIDVEDYYMSPPNIGPEDWDRFPDRLDQSVGLLLEWLADAGQSATFFVLGAVADRAPLLIRRISEAGHEVGIHGWDHQMLSALGREEFIRHLTRAREAVESATGERVEGFRAAAFSLDQRTPWAYDVLLDQGFRYDASSAPYYGWLYGEPMASARVHYRRAPSGRELLEVPLTVVGFKPFRVPAAGGFFLRIYPYALMRYLLRRCARRGQATVTYIHPWEAQSTHPELPLAGAQKFLHFAGLRGAPGKIKRLLADFQFTSIRTLLDEGDLAPERGRAGPCPDTP